MTRIWDYQIYFKIFIEYGLKSKSRYQTKKEKNPNSDLITAMVCLKSLIALKFKVAH